MRKIFSLFALFAFVALTYTTVSFADSPEDTPKDPAAVAQTTPAPTEAVQTEPAQATQAPASSKISFSFSGPFGHYDKAQLRRGFQVFSTVCSSCHSLKFITWRHLLGIGLSEEKLKAMAANYTVTDGLDDNGTPVVRAAKLKDFFPKPFANKKMAEIANGGLAPPDLTLFQKNYFDGSLYIYHLLTGYTDAPEGFSLPDGKSYNATFDGHVMGMMQPLWGDDVVYEDGTPATLEQEAQDVTAFLTWTANPHLDNRKAIGRWAILYTILLAILTFLVKKSIWKRILLYKKRDLKEENNKKS